MSKLKGTHVERIVRIVARLRDQNNSIVTLLEGRKLRRRKSFKVREICILNMLNIDG
jgi:hypothetical protein